MLLTLAAPIAGGSPPPPERAAPPGQVTIVTVNGEQAKVLDVRRFNMLFNLTRALRRRPPAFDGGWSGAAQTADVITLQEMTFSNIEILQKLLNQRHDADFQVGGSVEPRAKFLYNANTVAPVGDSVVWVDPCLDGNEGRELRQYQFVRFTELATGTPFVVAGIHFNKNYKRADCLLKNVEEMRAQLAGETSAVIIGGDFNKRSVATLRECDPEEATEPQPWWLAMTQPAEGHAYTDVIRSTHSGRSMADEWTHEWRTAVRNCDGVMRPRRSRIDYLFSFNATIADAHTDHPGWAGSEAGQENEDFVTHGKYSDHRFVWGRFVIAGPEQPAPPETTLGSEGTVELTWQTVTATTQWRVYRATGTSAYRRIATVPASTTQTQTYMDADTAHALTYRYAIAPVDEQGAQGAESGYGLATPDAQGPDVVWTAPPPARRTSNSDLVSVSASTSWSTSKASIRPGSGS